MNKIAASPVKTRVTWPLRLMNWAGWALLYAILTLGAVIMAFPFYWMLTTAFKGLSESVAIPPTMWPTTWVWTNFTDAWQAAPFPRYFLNTVIMAVGSTLGTLITGVLAAYAFARMRFFGKDIIFMMFLATMMINRSSRELSAQSLRWVMWRPRWSWISTPRTWRAMTSAVALPRKRSLFYATHWRSAPSHLSSKRPWP